MLLHSYLGILPAKQGETPPYIRVLGANARGRELLKRMRKTALLPVITKPAQARELDDAARECFLSEAACTDLYTLGMPQLTDALPDSEFARPAVMTGLDQKKRSCP